MKAKLLLLATGLVLTSAASAVSVPQEARQLIASGDAGIALVQLDTYLATSPKDAEARFARGIALSRLGRNADAIRAFSELIRDVPQFPEPYNNLGVLLAGNGDYAKARSAFEIALAKNPQYTAAQLNLADIDVALATQAYQNIVNRDPANTEAQLKLILLKNVQTAEAKRGAAVAAVPASANTGVSVAPPPPFEPIVTRPLETAPLEAPTPVPPAAVNTPEPAALAALAQADVVSVKRLPETGSPALAVVPVPAAAAASPTPDAALITAAAGSETDAAVAKRGVADTIQAWADAWSQRDADRHLSFYAKDFDPPGKKSREQWLAERRNSITAAQHIKLSLDKVRLTMISSDHAQVSFRQNLQADQSTTSGDKTLELRNLGGAWMIVGEKS